MTGTIVIIHNDVAQSTLASFLPMYKSIWSNSVPIPYENQDLRACPQTRTLLFTTALAQLWGIGDTARPKGQLKKPH
jgi:hypothetical protein